MSKFILPDLPYEYGSLEPYIDKLTMEIHHQKHHGGYTAKLNDGIMGTNYEDMEKIEDILSSGDLPVAVRNNGGGFYNHTLFWRIMSPDGGGVPADELNEAIVDNFGSFDEFRESFSEAAAKRFGSGWAWLIVQEGKLIITSTPNQDNPLMVFAEEKGTPILGLDVWEHAYYLNYKNNRPEYIQNWWNVVSWKEVNKRYRECVQ